MCPKPAAPLGIGVVSLSSEKKPSHRIAAEDAQRSFQIQTGTKEVASTYRDTATPICEVQIKMSGFP